MVTDSFATQATLDEATLETFYRDGVALVPGVLSRDECARLIELTDQHALDEDSIANGHVTPAMSTMVLRYIQALDQTFAALAVRDPIYGYVSTILGPSPKLCGMNVIRSYTNQAISMWHIDDILEVPLAPGQERHDPRMRMPVTWFTVQVALTDITTLSQGPTEIVPGSHYSGLGTSDADDHVFEGKGPTPIFCKAGDAYLFNHQVWHRGAPNTSPDTRYLMQIQYCRLAIHRRFCDKRNTEAPPNLDRSNPQLLDVLALS